MRHTLVGEVAPKIGDFWCWGCGSARNAAVRPVKADFPDFGGGSRGIVALNRKRPLKSAPTASERYTLENPVILGRFVCSIFSIGWGFGPLRWLFCEGVVSGWPENAAERPSTGVFPDFLLGLGLWEG